VGISPNFGTDSFNQIEFMTFRRTVEQKTGAEYLNAQKNKIA